MNATWMNSDSQLSTYMNHMAPPGRRDGPARSGSRDTERRPPYCPRPTDAERSKQVGAPPPVRSGQARERRQPARRIELALHPAPRVHTEPRLLGPNQAQSSNPAPHGRDFSVKGKLPYLRSHTRKPNSPESRVPLNGHLLS